MEQVRYAAASGVVHEGEKLPTVRELARHLGVNPNTVSKAYHELERDGIVYTQRGKGVFVASSQSVLGIEEKQQIITKKLDSIVVDAIHLGIPLKDLTALLKKRIQYWNQQNKP
jgi:GntR family transcriptional regulator